jgi:hypothetical protein
MGLKTAGVGHFTIPTAPAAGTSCTSGAANAFTTTYVQLIASTSAALYITGVHLESAAALAATYIVLQLATGGAGSETIIGQYLIPLSTGSTVALGYRQVYPPIPVANAARISCKTADSVGAKATLVTLECIAQSNVVDDGITVGTVATVNTLTTYTGNTVQTGDAFARLGAPAGASVSADVAAVNAKTTNLPAAPASTTNITAGTITTVTNLTNAPTAGDLTATMKTSVTTAATAATPTAAAVTGAVGSVTAGVTLAASQHVIVDSGTVTTLTNLPAITAGWLTATGIAASALNGKGDWNIGKTGYSLTQAFPTNFAAMSLTAGGLVTLAGVTHTGAVIPTVSAVTGLTASNLDAAISSRAAASDLAIVASYVDTEVAAIKAKTDNLPATPASSGDVTTVGAAVAAISTTLGTPAGVSVSADVAAVKADTAAVKTATDQLAFTAGSVNTNIKAINGTVVTGSGTAIAPWGP